MENILHLSPEAMLPFSAKTFVQSRSNRNMCLMWQARNAAHVSCLDLTFQDMGTNAKSSNVGVETRRGTYRTYRPRTWQVRGSVPCPYPQLNHNATLVTPGEFPFAAGLLPGCCWIKPLLAMCLVYLRFVRTEYMRLACGVFDHPTAQNGRPRSSNSA